MILSAGRLQAFISYYHRIRTHLALEKDAPDPRSVQPPDAGLIISIPEVGGLHHRYERRAACTGLLDTAGRNGYPLPASVQSTNQKQGATIPFAAINDRATFSGH